MFLKGFVFVFFSFFLFFTGSVNANTNTNTNYFLSEFNDLKPLDSKSAFSSFITEEKDKVVVKFSIANDYYLYKDKIKVFFDNQEQNINYDIISQEVKEDEFFGKVNVFKYNLSFYVDKNLSNFGKEVKFTLEYQGCAEKLSLCYPKELEVVNLINKDYNPNLSSIVYNSFEDTNYFSDFLINNSIYLNIFILLILGILLSFTPCVFPVYPLILNIISKNTNKILAVCSYSIGYITAYFIIGFIFSLYKINLQLFFQIDTVFYILAAIFFFIALTCFDFISIKIPHFISDFIDKKINYLYLKINFFSLFLIGLLSAIVISPCAVAPVSGVLVIVNQINNLFLGGVYLSVLALGMMLPFIILSIIGKKVKIKSSSLVFFKYLIGVLMLSVSVYIISKNISLSYSYFLYSLILIFIVTFLLKIKNYYKYLLFLILAIFLYIFFSGYKNTEHYSFYNQVDVTTLSEVKKELLLSKNKEEPVLINIHANWCIECLRMKKTTFNDIEVKNELKRYKVINVDVSENKEIKEILNYFDLQTVPIYVLYNSDGKKNNKYLLGYIEKSKFIDIINNIK